jgi:hypothetical protein
MGVGNEAYIDLPVGTSPRRRKRFSSITLRSLGLHLRIHVADLVEKHRAAVRDFEKSNLARNGTGKSSLFTVEKL